jgi:hypothetical protein
MSRNGKIAHLTRELRHQINQRLEDGQEADAILAWLNGMEGVQQMLEENFAGAPISAQNLSEWRQGGFREWSLRRAIIEQAASASELAEDLEEEIITPLLAGKLAAIVAARYAGLLSQWDGSPDAGVLDGLSALRALNRDIALLQKTLYLAQKQKREYEQALQEEETWEMEELKKRETAPIHAHVEAEAMEVAAGGRGEGPVRGAIPGRIQV